MARDASHGLRYMSHVTRHTSHVTRHTPHVTRHSNLLTWRESGATVLPVAPCPHSCIDLVHLSQQLQLARDMGASLVVGAFTAASNVTGALADVHAVTAVLHAHAGVYVCVIF